MKQLEVQQRFPFLTEKLGAEAIAWLLRRQEDCQPNASAMFGMFRRMEARDANGHGTYFKKLSRLELSAFNKIMFYFVADDEMRPYFLNLLNDINTAIIED